MVVVIFIDNKVTAQERWGHSLNNRAAWSRAHNWKTGWSELRPFQTLQQHGRSSRKQKFDTSITEVPELASRSGESTTRRNTESRTGPEPTLHTTRQDKTGNEN